MAIDDEAVALDGVDDVRLGTHAFVRDRRVEGREIDRPHRLRAEHDRIVARAFAIDLGFVRERAKTVEAGLRLFLDAAVEQAHGGEVARILQRAAQRHGAAAAAVVVLRRPIVGLANASAADRRQRDRLVQHQRVRLQAVAERRQIAQRLDRRAGLALRLDRAVELAQRIGEAARHRKDAAGLVLQHHRHALHDRPHPQLGARRALALALGHAHEHHVVERELPLRGAVVDRERQDAAVAKPTRQPRPCVPVGFSSTTAGVQCTS